MKTKQHDTSPEGDAVLHSIIDHELEVQAHVEDVLSTLGPTKGKLKKLARRLYNARAKGDMTRGEAKRAWREGFLLLALYEYASDVSSLMGIVNESLEAQYKAVRAFAKTGKKLTTLRPIRNIDIKTRATAKAQAKDSATAGVKEAKKLYEHGVRAFYVVEASRARIGEKDARDMAALATIDLADKTGLNGPGSGRLPNLSKVREKTPDEMVRTLKRFGLEPDLRAIDKAAQRAYESRLEGVIEEKGEPDKATWDAIDSEVERAVSTVLRHQTKEAIRDYKLERIRGVAEYFVWVATGTGSCDSCEERHGERRTMSAWEKRGLPGAPVLICKKDCKCSLVPDLVD